MSKFEKISDLTPAEFRKYLAYLLHTEGNRAAQRLGAEKLIEKPFSIDLKENATHDIWNFYRYGNVLKAVYIKSRGKHKKPSQARTACETGTGEQNKTPQLPETTKKSKAAEKEERERFSQSISRTKARIFELAACNEFNFFCTFTQDEKKRDRFNLSDFREDFAQLVRNLNRSRVEGEKIKYLLIPEHHKNGAWHMHGLLMGLTPSDLRPFTLDEKLPYRLRRQLEKGVKIYDWTRYRRSFGYFTCTEIENAVAVSKYITKYITKDLKKTAFDSGEHMFFASQGLKSRERLVWRSFEKCPFEEWDFENDFVKIKELQIDPETGEIKN